MVKKRSIFKNFRNFFLPGNNEPEFDTSSTRRIRGWAPGSSGPNSSVIYSLTDMRNKSRDLTRKFPVMNSGYRTLVANLVATGIKVLPKTANEKFNDAIKEAWEIFNEEADREGIHELTALIELAVRERFEAGEVFIRHLPCRSSAGLNVPYQIQVLEPEMVPLDYNTTLNNGGCIIGGIEFDASGRRVAYHMYKHHPGDTLCFKDSYQTVRVPASEVCHYFKPLRAGQVRGLPECFASLVKARDLMVYEESELIRKKMAAMLAGFIKTPEDAAETTNADSNDFNTDPGEAMMKLEPGILMALAPGEDIVFNSPAEVGNSFEPYMKSSYRQIAASIGLTYEEFSRDLSGVNFSSIRTGLNQSQREHRQEQQRIIHMLLRPIFQYFVEQAILSGAVSAPDFVNHRRTYFNVKYQAPGWSYVNPVQEVQAVKEKIKAGLMSREQAVAELGYDVEEIDAQIDRDAERAAALGLVFDIDPTLGKGAPPTFEQEAAKVEKSSDTVA